MNALQYFLECLELSPYESDCIDDMKRQFAPVRGEFYPLDDGRLGVDWFNCEGRVLKGPDGTSTNFFDGCVFRDAFERSDCLRLESLNEQGGGVVSIRGSDAEDLHPLIQSVRRLVQFFATRVARHTP